MHATVECLYLQRFFKQWAGCTVRPPKLLEETDAEWNTQTTWQLVRTCINKLYKLSAFLSQQSVVSITTSLVVMSLKFYQLETKAKLPLFLTIMTITDTWQTIAGILFSISLISQIQNICLPESLARKWLKFRGH